ncbi:hypothetical protein [Streptomyces agglomeratus]|uniref:hypothetical protein n=1 Tax=Streptomyces agglomeratus TaxID=285458 RepID=UPI0014289113|nr:hypothetical protein [Streptomyces agglomeratus]
MSDSIERRRSVRWPWAGRHPADAKAGRRLVDEMAAAGGRLGQIAPWGGTWL